MTATEKRYYELQDDLIITADLFHKSNNKKVKEAINKLRLPLIVAYNELGAITRSNRHDN